MKIAESQKLDILLIDTAGRLHNAPNLMEELAKLTRVLKKIDKTAPQNVVQVLDATTGQNALSQVEAFRETAGVTGLMVTKLDGSAHGGIVVALAQRFGLPIHAVGIFEGIADLHPFKADAFAHKSIGTGKHLIEGLKKLSVTNLGNLPPDPFTVWLSYSHPPILDRIKALDVSD